MQSTELILLKLNIPSLVPLYFTLSPPLEVCVKRKCTSCCCCFCRLFSSCTPNLSHKCRSLTNTLNLRASSYRECFNITYQHSRVFYRKNIFIFVLLKICSDDLSEGFSHAEAEQWEGINRSCFFKPFQTSFAWNFKRAETMREHQRNSFRFSFQLLQANFFIFFYINLGKTSFNHIANLLTFL